MSEQDGILISKRKPSALNRELGVNFKDLFLALSKGGVDLATGRFDLAAKNAINVVGVVKNNGSIEATVWSLIYRAINMIHP